MNVITLAQQAASMKGWPVAPGAAASDGSGTIRIEVPTEGGRTQLVSIMMGKDGDGDAVGFLWSYCGDYRVLNDLMGILKLNAQLTYGKVAMRGDEVGVLHAIYDASAELAAVGKAIYYVAKAADDLERTTYGSDTL